MKRTFISAWALAAGLFTCCILSSFKTVTVNALQQNVLKVSAFNKAEPVTFYTVATELLPDGSTYIGTVRTEGAINEEGTYLMTTQVLGTALHCTLITYFPEGTLTIRMNCNMKTFDGRWKILEGTGAYHTAKGEGPLVMPNDIEEILTGVIRL